MIYKIKTKILVTLFIISTLIVLSACSLGSKPDRPLETEIFALDTIISMSIWGGSQEILDRAVAICYEYENLLSKSIEKSDVYKLNHSKGEYVSVSKETIYLLRKSIEFSKLSNGYFDITVLPVKDLWDFKSKTPYIPKEEEIKKQLLKVDYNNIIIEENLVKLKNEAQIDLGAVAKGYIADQISNYLKSEGIQRGILNLGGNVVMIGEKSKSIPWSVGIKNPQGDPNEYIATVDIKDCSVVTSGIYERFFEVDSVVYHHLLNPFSGYPVRNSVQSVTIISQNSLDADILSTACFVLGVEKGIELIENIEKTEAIYIMDNMKIIKSSGVENYNFEIAN